VEVIAVTPDAERRGVARALMDAIEEWARRRGYRHVTLNVFDGNARARALYGSLGYQAETIHFRKSL
jgi:GNAT superfamily N-acetyltransferase